MRSSPPVSWSPPESTPVLATLWQRSSLGGGPADVRGPGTRERGHQGCPGPKIIGPSAKRQGAALLVGDHRLPVRQACRVMRLSRAAYYRPPVPASRRDAAVIAALTDAVARYPRWGFWKCFDRLRVEGRSWNHKHVHRVYCALRLNLPRRTTRRVPHRVRQPLTAPPVLNRTWALDFMSETLYDGRRVRLLTVIDEGNREGLEIAMGLSVPSQRVVRVLNELVVVHGCPAALRTDNGAGIYRAAVHRLVRRPPGGDPLHPAGQARPECLHRAVQPELSHGGAQRPSL